MRIFSENCRFAPQKCEMVGCRFFVFGVMNIVQHQCIIDPPRLGLHASFGGFFLA